ncbi:MULTISPECIES: hypothetical protein [unclassified Mesorhizobium]|uniref:hypothetical protein n=1 Tax=unclassified Mesorhizobium TaxID=325217 RepID=UPI00112DF82F|nr:MULTISPECIES: hypothetical protein [unclassified Mesorhizobium]TPJ51771.1 hypothetical protein FJ426_18880 [Mesorhizobium sp. B2-6-4]TPN42393.1 hypothetical protein FJ979_02295 [Mesorhizobium sp. B1-1-6]
MKAPDGTAIVATLENTPGTCGVVFENDGTWDFDGSGTEHNYDGQETVTRADQTVFIDEDGKEWLESQLIPDSARPRKNIKPWFHDRELRRIEIVNTIESLMERTTGKKLKVAECEYLTRAVTLLLTRSEPEK